MWQLIKAEFVYNRALLLFAYFFGSIPFFLFFASWKYSYEEISLILMMICLVIPGGISAGILAGMGARRYKEKRERLYALLPISVRRVGLARALLPLLLWIGVVLLFWIIILIFSFYSVELKIIWLMLSINGLFLSLLPTEYMQHDVQYYFMRKSQKILWFSLILFRVVASLITLSLVAEALEFLHPLKPLAGYVFFSPWGALGLNIFAVLVIYLGVIVFAKRKSYAE
jgi:hypothetical protein